jgi:hypothetical protein
MAARSERQINMPQLSNVVLVVAIVLVIAIVIGLGRHYLAPSGPTVAQELDLDKHPIPAWVTSDAQQCKGNLYALSPQEQRKVEAAYPGQGARIIITAAYSLQH